MPSVEIFNLKVIWWSKQVYWINFFGSYFIESCWRLQLWLKVFESPESNLVNRVYFRKVNQANVKLYTVEGDYLMTAYRPIFPERASDVDFVKTLHWRRSSWKVEESLEGSLNSKISSRNFPQENFLQALSIEESPIKMIKEFSESKRVPSWGWGS